MIMLNQSGRNVILFCMVKTLHSYQGQGIRMQLVEAKEDYLPFAMYKVLVNRKVVASSYSEEKIRKKFAIFVQEYVLQLSIC